MGIRWGEHWETTRKSYCADRIYGTQKYQCGGDPHTTKKVLQMWSHTNRWRIVVNTPLGLSGISLSFFKCWVSMSFLLTCSLCDLFTNRLFFSQFFFARRNIPFGACTAMFVNEHRVHSTWKWKENIYIRIHSLKARCEWSMWASMKANNEKGGYTPFGHYEYKRNQQTF